MFPVSNPHLRPKTPLMRCAFDGAPHIHTFARSSNGPLTLALEAPGAGEVHWSEFRMPNGTHESETPFAGTSYGAWQLPIRTVTRRQHYCRLGGRLGPLVSGDVANITQTRAQVKGKEGR